MLEKFLRKGRSALNRIQAQQQRKIAARVDYGLYSYAVVYDMIKNSGVFDHNYYLSCLSKYTKMDPLDHYVKIGYKLNLNPSPFFSTRHYCEQIGNHAKGVNELAHYLSGGFQSFDPHPFFDQEYYYFQRPDIKKAGAAPLSHYIHHGFREGIQPCPLFNSQLYRLYHSELELGEDEFRHFLIESERDENTYSQITFDRVVLRLLKDGEFQKASQVYFFKNAYGIFDTKKFCSKILKLEPMKNFFIEPNQVLYKTEKSIVQISSPDIYVEDKKSQNFPEMPEGQVELPESFIGHIQNGQYIGGSGFLLNSETLYSEASERIESKVFGTKLRGAHQVLPGSVSLHLSKKISHVLEKCILFGEDHYYNYFHWLVEVVPKLILWKEIESQYPGYRVAVSNRFHPNLHKILKLVMGNKVEIVQIDDDVVYDCNDCIFLGALSRMYDRDSGEMQIDDCVIEPMYIFQAREIIFNQLKINRKLKPWRRLYLLRGDNKMRALKNEPHLVAELIRRGYEIVNLDNMDFISQVELFNQAIEVISPSGAACTNLMFCQPKTQFTILNFSHENANLYVFNQLSDIFDIQTQFYLGRQIRTLPEKIDIHDPFEIDIDCFCKNILKNNAM